MAENVVVSGGPSHPCPMGPWPHSFELRSALVCLEAHRVWCNRCRYQVAAHYLMCAIDALEDVQEAVDG